MKKKFAVLFTTLIAAAFRLCGMPRFAEAGPLSFTVTDSEAGDVHGGKQDIIFWFTVKNISHVEYIRRVNSVTVEVTGWSRGHRETYQRDVDIDWTFDPSLRPGASKKLRTRFSRRINPDRGWYRYDRVRVRVLRYNFRRAS